MQGTGRGREGMKGTLSPSEIPNTSLLLYTGVKVHLLYPKYLLQQKTSIKLIFHFS